MPGAAAATALLVAMATGAAAAAAQERSCSPFDPGPPTASLAPPGECVFGEEWAPAPLLQREARRVVCRGAAQRGELLDGVLLQRARRRVERDLARQRLRALRRHRRPPPVDAARAAGLGGVGLGFGLGLGLGLGLGFG